MKKKKKKKKIKNSCTNQKLSTKSHLNLTVYLIVIDYSVIVPEKDLAFTPKIRNMFSNFWSKIFIEAIEVIHVVRTQNFPKN